MELERDARLPEVLNPTLPMRVHLTRLPSVDLEAPTREFHVRRTARQRMGFDESFFSIRGDVVFSDVRKSHVFAAHLNAQRGVSRADGVSPAQVHAMGLMHEICHAVIGTYRKSVAPNTFRALADRLRAQHGADLIITLRVFVDTYPPPEVYSGTTTVDQYLKGTTAGVANEEWVLEELLLLWLMNKNPAYAPISDLVTDEPLRQSTAYTDLIASMEVHFEGEPELGATGGGLIDTLLAPIKHSPNSLAGQLAFMRDTWGLLLSGNDELLRLLLGLDLLTEEGRWFLRKSHGFAKDDAKTPHFTGELYEDEPERFSSDIEWMPRVVMLAKSTFVWLDQLSKRYERGINTLSDVPDEELDALASRGFTALWLIGLWRRSTASRKIKQINGNPEAVASAYSLHDYGIADELGGYEAYTNLRDRCSRRGIRLASDMVPNHMGVDSDWVVNHPDWFVQSPHPPFPGYSFNGPDLSDDNRVGIFIEDGYWNKTDAAVVFKRLDRHTGDARYVYHGNDGTSMPWNDTAQLNYLMKEVRESVIQTILHVARLFPIIRFDAAMTLAKRHYQRLWFPIPGKGGDIPSRAEHAMTREQFDEAFPVEFWREVVDRVEQEVPGTLLLAEAFWMMEGYFVRTLGMHRVYNSAFMHMLKKEDNAAFRSSIKNVLVYNPQILKRYVNFMNNPDEDTAVAQFGKDDKYFGVCLLMSTLPGLPMFGHGQIEGLTERYGMEYKRAYWDEQPDASLVARHEREICPLLEKRWLFSDVECFTLYDMFTPEGTVDEDVLAYSNRAGGARALILYHNKFKSTRGWIRMSVGFLDSTGAIVQRSLAEGLALTRADHMLLVFRDHTTGLEYIRRTDELCDKGMYVELEAFKYRAFVDFRDVMDTREAPYAELERNLGGAGVPSIEEALSELHFKPIHDPLNRAIAPGSVAYLASATTEQVHAALAEKLGYIADGVLYFEGSNDKGKPLADAVAPGIARFEGAREKTPLVVAWVFAAALESHRVDAYRTWEIARVVARAIRDGGADEGAAATTAELVGLLARTTVAPAATATTTAATATATTPTKPNTTATMLLRMLKQDAVRQFLRVNVHEGVVWFAKERFEALVEGLGAIGEGDASDAKDLTRIAAEVGYRLEELVATLRPKQKLTDKRA